MIVSSSLLISDSSSRLDLSSPRLVSPPHVFSSPRLVSLSPRLLLSPPHLLVSTSPLLIHSCTLVSLVYCIALRCWTCAGHIIISLPIRHEAWIRVVCAMSVPFHGPYCRFLLGASSRSITTYTFLCYHARLKQQSTYASKHRTMVHGWSQAIPQSHAIDMLRQDATDPPADSYARPACV